MLMAVKSTDALLCAILSALAGLFAATAEVISISGVWGAMCVLLAATATLIGAPLTHGLIGTRKYKDYQFFQPFEGGSRFVQIQSLAWSIYGLACLMFGYVFYFVLNQVIKPVGIIILACVIGIVSQYMVWISIHHFESRMFLRVGKTTLSSGTPRKVMQASAYALDELRSDFMSQCLVAVFYCLPAIASIILVSPVAIYGIKVIPAWLFIFYLYLQFGNPAPEKTGSRMWREFKGRAEMWTLFERYFSLRVIRTEKLDPSRQYVFGFHPHGIYPMTVFWATHGYKWRALFEGIEIVPLCATVIFYLPIMREICLWCGIQDVTKKSIHNAFNAGKSVVLVPGGEREMRVSRADVSRVSIITKHKGFVRLGLQRGVSLVPVFSFGENQLMENIYLPTVQEWFQKKILYGFPHLPYGRGYSPVPNARPVTLAVGKPIDLPQVNEPTEEQVNYYHKLYFDSLLELFHSNKKLCPGFENSVMEFLER
eukprot:TRINITY_DN8136_c0_g1_i1.p1 TRINITY_DN8136_c0_g1~~TRINITY_DN8136_c0_g1_i1.p1  ORF type:complete len:483 (+),score=98.78 TRINITY_DN8136_c0_g1_i1:127-1575(+)